jgi:hypothetical protein
MLKRLLMINIAILSVSLILTGCSGKKENLQANGGIKIYSWSSAIGGVNNVDLEKSKFSYYLNLTNENSKEILIKELEPIVSKSLSTKMISKNLVLNLNKKINPKETVEVKGEIIFYTEGMTKQDILALQPLITDIRVSSEEIINLKQEDKGAIE